MHGLLLAHAAASRCSGVFLLSGSWLALQLQPANLQPSSPAGSQNWPGVKAALRAACGSKAEAFPSPVPPMLKAAFSRWVWCLAGRGLLRVLAALFCFQIAFLEINANIRRGMMDALFFVKPHLPFFSGVPAKCQMLFSCVLSARTYPVPWYFGSHPFTCS